MKLNHTNFETLLFSIAIVLGAVLRFSNLGSAPLSDSEASLALQAMYLTRDSQGFQAILAQPGYLVLTQGWFSLIGSSNFGARFWPAFAGCLLPIVPWLLSKAQWGLRINRPTWIIMAYGLALTPGLVATARLASGQMMVMSFTWLAIALFISNKPIMAGIAAGAALASGPTAVTGVAILGLGWLLAKQLARIQSPQTNPEIIQPTTRESANHRREYLKLIAAMGATILLLSTGIFRFPAGLAGWFEALPEYLRGWFTSSSVPAMRLLIALTVYQPIAVIFSIPGGIRGLLSKTTNPEERLLALTSLSWIFIGLLIILINPARQVADVIWVIVPLIALASWEISHYLPEGRIHPVSILHALLLIILMGLLWYSLASISRIPAEDTERTARWLIVAGVFTFGALTTILIQLGWSWKIARYGLVWGVLGGLLLFSTSMLSGAIYMRSNQPQELWAPPPAPGQADLVLQTLQELSWRSTGRPGSIDVVSLVDSPSLRWLLRNFSNARFANQLESGSMPSVLITPQDQTAPELPASYLGQDFTWANYPGWEGALPNDLPGWITFRRAPLEQRSIILWARSDRFPGGTLVLPPSDAPVLPEEDLLEYPEIP
jgi:hypothetical protein